MDLEVIAGVEVLKHGSQTTLAQTVASRQQSLTDTNYFITA